MNWKTLLVPLCGIVVGGLVVGTRGFAGKETRPSWTVSDAIEHRGLQIFPVIAGRESDTSAFLTLDEGLKAGTVVVSELGQGGLIRRREGTVPPVEQPQVNKLALENRSGKILVLLAGEVVSGGKQDRIIARDRLVAPGGQLPLDVFCVERGRWHGLSASFNSRETITNPSVRREAQVARDQSKVWGAVGGTIGGVANTVAAPVEAPTGAYESIYASRGAAKAIDTSSSDLYRQYERALSGKLAGQRVVGVVVALNGEVIWADVFASSDLFRRYWPKLLRSYVVETLAHPSSTDRATTGEAAAFLAQRSGREVIEREPSEYELAQVESPEYTIFELASLFPKQPIEVHFNKLRKEQRISRK